MKNNKSFNNHLNKWLPIKGILFVLLIFYFFCCSKQKINRSENTIHLSVDLEQKDKVSIFDLFQKIEIIPLETKDASLIKSISKIEYYNQKYYILDRETSLLLCFDSEGKHIGNIGQIGNGPEDYFSAYDFLIDKSKNCIVILSPVGLLYFYDLSNGKLADKIQLKNGAPNYQRFVMLNDDIFIFYTLGLEQQLFLFSREQGNFIDSYYEENKVLSMFSNDVFYTFNDEVFFSEPFVNEVYKIKETGMEVAYRWDFGNMNMDLDKFNLPSGRDNGIRKIIEMLRDSQLHSLCDIQIQTGEYYYARSLRNLEHQLHLFYHKKTNKTYIFEKFSEDIFFYPACWCNDFVIATSNFHAKPAVIQTILDKENNYKLNQICEDDNPYIIRYWYRPPT
jgi:hypothetical protein